MSQLSGVSVVAPHDAWAVGGVTDPQDTYHSLIERYHDGRWSVARVPEDVGPGGLTSVSAGLLSDAWAVGQQQVNDTYRPVTLVRSGGRWMAVDSPHPGEISGLASVDAAGPGRTWAVGSQQLPTGGTATLIERWTHGQWLLQLSP